MRNEYQIFCPDAIHIDLLRNLNILLKKIKLTRASYCGNIRTCVQNNCLFLHRRANKEVYVVISKLFSAKNRIFLNYQRIILFSCILLCCLIIGSWHFSLFGKS